MQISTKTAFPIVFLQGAYLHYVLRNVDVHWWLNQNKNLKIPFNLIYFNFLENCIMTVWNIFIDLLYFYYSYLHSDNLLFCTFFMFSSSNFSVYIWATNVWITNFFLFFANIIRAFCRCCISYVLVITRWHITEYDPWKTAQTHS